MNFDFSVGKNFRFTETLRLQFRAEFFNIMNTPNFALQNSVGLVFGTPTFAKVTTAGDPRVVQFGLKLVF